MADLKLPMLDQRDAFSDALMTAMIYLALRDLKQRDVRIARRSAGALILRRLFVGQATAASSRDRRAAGPHFHQPAPVEQRNVAGQPFDLADPVADEDDRDRKRVAHLLDVTEDVHPARVVERGERFVQQQQARTGEQGAPDRDALLLAARQAVRAARQQRADAEQRRRPRRNRQSAAPAA